MNKRRMAMLLALVMILAAALSACGSGSAEQSSQTPAAQSTAPSSTPSTPASSAPSTPSEPAKTEENRHYAVDADTVVVATADEAPSVTARKHNAAEAGYNNNLMYQGLMTMDANLAPQPCLARARALAVDSSSADGQSAVGLHSGSPATILFVSIIFTVARGNGSDAASTDHYVGIAFLSYIVYEAFYLVCHMGNYLDSPS